MSEEKEKSKEILGMCSEDQEQDKEKTEEIHKDLPQERGMFNAFNLYYYQQFWVPDNFLQGVVSAQKNFMPCENDIILTSCPKSGTTWLKSITFLIVHRCSSNDSSLAYSLFLNANPHDLVPFLEYDKVEEFQYPNSYQASPLTPRLINTHIPYELLPSSTKASSSKIVYISRNPMDQFTSYWHFIPKIMSKEGEPCDLEESFDMFCRGIHSFGPFWSHVLGYWKASLEMPQKVLFLKYEDLKRNPLVNIKRLADFIGLPFSAEEEENGVIEKIIALSSFENMKNTEVNKNGQRPIGIPHSAFFRNGEIGDSKNYLTPTMMERMEKLMQEKYGEHYSSLKSSF